MYGRAIQNNINAVVKRRIPSPSGRRPGRGDINKEELFFILSPLPSPLPVGEGV
jgi:hypothetical protein